MVVMYKEAHIRRRDKSGPGKPATQRPPQQATVEQIRIAQLVGEQNEDDVQLSKNVLKIVEVTGVSEEQASLALYDSNDDPSRAIELLLEKQMQGEKKDNGWETAGRRKNRGGNSATRAADTFEDETKDENSGKNKSDRNTSSGGGRGRGRKARQFGQSRPGPDDSKDSETMQNMKDRRPGRGRSRSGPNRGRGRGAPRHSRNRDLGGRSGGGDNSGAQDNRNSLEEPVDMWESTSVKCWDIEVGTWSSKDVKKQQATAKAAASHDANWGTESWADDLSESRVFQAQTTSAVATESGNTSGGGSSKTEVGSNHDRMANTVPQTGERIDLGMLFKKSGEVQNQTMQGVGNYGRFVSMARDKSGHNGIASNQPEVVNHVQGFQQHNQMKAPFGESGVSATSRLFSDYEQTQHNQQSVPASLFQSDETSNMLKNSYSQLNGNVSRHNPMKDSSSFLESFGGISSQSNQESQPDILGQFGGLTNTRSQLPPYSQLRMPISKDSTSASLQRQNPGIPAQTTDAMMGNLDNLSKSRDEDHLSFGSPLPPQINQQSRQQRKKMPTLSSKIPASAVEMPGNKGGYSTQDYTQFSLQFGADDPASLKDLANHDYGVTIPHSISSAGIMPQSGGLFLNGSDASMNTSSVMHSAGNTDSLFSQNLQNSSSSNTDHQEMEERGSMPGVLDHSIKVPPGLSMPPAAPTSSSMSNNNSAATQHGSNFLSHGGEESNSGRVHDSSFHRSSSLNSSYSQDVSPYYSTSTSTHTGQSPRMMPGTGNPAQQMLAPVQPSSLSDNMSQSVPTQAVTENTESSSHSANMSSLTAGLNQVGIPQSMHGQAGDAAAVSHSSGGGSPYASTAAAVTSESHASPGSSSVSSTNRKPGYNTVQNNTQVQPRPYDETAGQSNRTPTALSQMPQHGMSQTIPNANESTTVNQTSAFKVLTSSTASPTVAPKMPPAESASKGNINVPSGVAAPIHYGIPMAGLMPYATPEMQYPYDQLLLAQSRVVNPLSFYDMHYHGNTQAAAAAEGQDSSASIGQSLPGHGKYNRNDTSSSTPPTQLNMPGTVGSELSQHNTSIPMQPVPPKAVTQSSAHHTGQQQYVGAMPAYHNYGSLATPYYSLGMANPGFQYPATMFAAAAMHQAPKHAVSTADGFQQQPSGRYNHTSAAITSSSGLSDLSRSNYPKTHPSGLEKQQGYHQHTNTPPPFNLQTLTAAVAAGGGATTGNTAPGLSPYAAPPYMALLPHHTSQQQMHLLQHQHQDPTSGHPVGSQRNLGSSSIVKPTKRGGGYGTASSYWGN